MSDKQPDDQPPVKRGRGQPRKPPDLLIVKRGVCLNNLEVAAFLAATKSKSIAEGIRLVNRVGTAATSPRR